MDPEQHQINQINWKYSHTYTWVYLAVCFSAALIPTPNLGWISKEALGLSLTCVLTFLGPRVLKSYQSSIKDFKPINKHEAKIANEQIKLIATFLNSGSIAIFVIVVIGPYFNQINQSRSDNILIILGIVIIFFANIGARNTLGCLKNEDTFSE
jgi:hypothetical protein